MIKVKQCREKYTNIIDDPDFWYIVEIFSYVSPMNWAYSSRLIFRYYHNIQTSRFESDWVKQNSFTKSFGKQVLIDKVFLNKKFSIHHKFPTKSSF